MIDQKTHTKIRCGSQYGTPRPIFGTPTSRNFYNAAERDAKAIQNDEASEEATQHDEINLISVLHDAIA